MAWARHVGATLAANIQNPGASWIAGSLGATPVSGERIIAVIDVNLGASQPTVTGITDGAGNAWTRDLQGQFSHGGYFEELSVWSCVSNGSAATAITPAFSPSLSASSGAGISVGTYSGLSTTTGAAAAVDVSTVNEGSGSTADSGTTSGHTSAANELKIGAIVDAGYSLTYAAGTIDTTYSFFIKGDNNGNAQTGLEDADSGASNATARAEATNVGSFWVAGVVVYKLASAATLIVDAPRGDRRPFPFTPGSAHQRM